MLHPDDLLSVVREDVEYLATEWDQEISDASLRRASPVLRRLLVEGELQRAWKAAGFEKQPLIECTQLHIPVEIEHQRHLVFAMSGGASYRGGKIFSPMFFKTNLSSPPKIENVRAVLPLTQFVAAPSIAALGRIASRRQVIKYVTNKLGGAHHDTKRKDDGEELCFVALDKAFNNSQLMMQFMGKPPIYFELLSIGQAVGKSPDVLRLIGKG